MAVPAERALPPALTVALPSVRPTLVTSNTAGSELTATNCPSPGSPMLKVTTVPTFTVVLGVCGVSTTGGRVLPPIGPCVVDVVLVDAPCSGSGTWRRTPELKWRLTTERLTALTALQARLLDEGARHTKQGGRLVYATCSLLPEENESQVEAFIQAAPEFRPLAISSVWKETLGTTAPAGDPWLRLSPARHGTDGFFVALLARRT